jgi:hypothetical protein
MIFKKAILLAALVALSSTPAWALPGDQHSSAGKPVAKGNPHGTPGSNSKGAGHDNQGNADKGNGADKGKGKGTGNGSGKSKSHRCAPHAVAYVASGAFVSDTLVENADHTFSGEVTVEVKHGNRHARGDKGTTKVYKLEGAHLTLAVPDRDNDNVVGVDDLMAGDHAQVIGRITTLTKKCPVGEFTPKLTIRKVVFHGPQD